MWICKEKVVKKGEIGRNENSSELKNSILVLHCSDATKSIWNTYLDMHDWKLHWQKKLMYWTIVWFHCQIGFFQWWIMCWFSVHIHVKKKEFHFLSIFWHNSCNALNHVLMIILGVSLTLNELFFLLFFMTKVVAAQWCLKMIYSFVS